MYIYIYMCVYIYIYMYIYIHIHTCIHILWMVGAPSPTPILLPTGCSGLAAFSSPLLMSVGVHALCSVHRAATTGYGTDGSHPPNLQGARLSLVSVLRTQSDGLVELDGCWWNSMDGNYTRENSLFWTLETPCCSPRFILFPSSPAWCSLSHLSLSLVFARSFRVASSSHSLYDPYFRVSRIKRDSIALVKQSASCSPERTQRSWIPSFRASWMALATNWTMNSEQDGGAVLVVRSNRLLQSVIARSDESFIVGTVMAGANFFKASSGFLHRVVGSCNQLQKSLNHDTWSTALASAFVSADYVLVTTFWIFLLPHHFGLIAHWTFWDIFWWVPTMKSPACESGFFCEEKDASENAMNRKSSTGIGLMVMVTSWNLLASCRSLLPSWRVPIVACGMADCNRDRRLDKSGRVFVAAHCKLPTSLLKANLSASVTGSSVWVLRLVSIWIDFILRT